MYAVYCCDATLLEETHEFVSSVRFRDHGVSSLSFRPYCKTNWYWKRNQLPRSDATVGYSTAQARSNVNTQYDVAFTEYARFGGNWPNFCGNDPGGRVLSLATSCCNVLFEYSILLPGVFFYLVEGPRLNSSPVPSPTYVLGQTKTMQSASRLRRVVHPAAATVRLDSLRFDSLKRRRRIP